MPEDVPSLPFPLRIKAIIENCVSPAIVKNQDNIQTCCLKFPEKVKPVGCFGLVSVNDEGNGEGDHDGNDHVPGL